MLTENYNSQLSKESPAKLSIQFSCIECKHWKVGASSVKDTGMSQIPQYMIQRMFDFLHVKTLKILLPKR